MQETRLVELAQRIRADDTFRREAVRLAKSSTKPVTAVAKELGVGNSTLYRWMARYADANPTDSPAASSLDRKLTDASTYLSHPAQTGTTDDELDRLRSEVKFLRDENEILRRAALAFARTPFAT